MNILLWVLQVLAALLYGSSGVMKVFMFDKVSKDVPSFGALPRKAWMTLGTVMRRARPCCSRPASTAQHRARHSHQHESPSPRRLTRCGSLPGRGQDNSASTPCRSSSCTTAHRMVLD